MVFYKRIYRIERKAKKQQMTTEQRYERCQKTRSHLCVR
jgi:hypothetical protein